MLRLLLLMPFIANACPTWHAKIEASQSTGWDYQLNPQNIVVVADPLETDSQVIQLTITPDSTWPNGHTRTEVKHNGCTTDEGESTFFSWEFYLDKPIKTINNIAYWESDKSYQQSMGFYLEPILNNNQVSSILTFFSSLPDRITHWQQAVSTGKWIKIAMAITWSESKNNGQVSIWFNHQPVVTDLTIKTKPDANKLFVQLGLHRNQTEPAIDTIYLRNIKEVANLNKLLKEQ